MKTAAIIAVGWLFARIFTPEVIEFLTAAMIPLNTIILLFGTRWLKRRIDNDIVPPLDEAAASATRAANTVDRRGAEQDERYAEEERRRGY